MTALFNSTRVTSEVCVTPQSGLEENSPPPAHKATEQQEEYCYLMNHPCRGKAVIFNNDEFESQSPRPGSQHDVQTLRETLKLLGLADEDIVIRDNFTFQMIKEELERLSKEDYTDYDCLFVTILSHGLNEGLIFAKDALYEDQRVWNSFTAEKCKTLVGKPKIFFIQACRGGNFDEGIDVEVEGARDDNAAEKDSCTEEVDAVPTSYTVPSHADFLIAHSSWKDKVSVRHPVYGTWFIQSLCRELKENWRSVDLLDILTRTVRRVACDHEANDCVRRWKQAPTITSTLTRDLYFFPTQT